MIKSPRPVTKTPPKKKKNIQKDKKKKKQQHKKPSILVFMLPFFWHELFGPSNFHEPHKKVWQIFQGTMDGFSARVFLFSYIMNLNNFQREVKKKNWLAQHKTVNHASKFSSITVNTRTCCCKAVICVYTRFHVMLFSLISIPHMHLHDLADTRNLKFLMEGIPSCSDLGYRTIHSPIMEL